MRGEPEVSHYCEVALKIVHGVLSWVRKVIEAKKLPKNHLWQEKKYVWILEL